MTRHQFSKIVEMRTKVISMGTFFSALSYALYLHSTLIIPTALLMGFATLFVDMGTTGFNSFYDFVRGTDNKTYTVEEEKVLVHQGVDPRSALVVSAISFGLAGALGLLLAYLTSWWLIPIGALSMATGYLYTGGPYPISRTPGGELFAGSFLGTVLFLITLYTQAIAPSAQALLASLPFLLFIAMILSVNNACDRVGDQASGRRTLAILLGERYAPLLVAFEGFGAYGLSWALIALGIYPTPLAIPLALTFVLFFFRHRRVRRIGYRAQTKSPHMDFAAQSYVTYCAAFIIGMVGSHLLAIGS